MGLWVLGILWSKKSDANPSGGDTESPGGNNPLSLLFFGSMTVLSSCQTYWRHTNKTNDVTLLQSCSLAYSYLDESSLKFQGNPLNIFFFLVFVSVTVILSNKFYENWWWVGAKISQAERVPSQVKPSWGISIFELKRVSLFLWVKLNPHFYPIWPTKLSSNDTCTQFKSRCWWNCW